VLAAWILFPALLLGVSLGVGLLTEALAGRRLPGALLAPLGIAGITVAGLATTAFPETAKLTTPLAVLLALVGFALAIRRRRSLRPDPWPLGVAFAVFLVFAAPVVLSGEATFAGYIKLDDTATWFAITDRLMEHGRDISDLPPSSYEATLDFNVAGWYPVAPFIPFGVGARLTGSELAWVFQPYLALLASFTALALWQLTARVRAAALLRAGAVVLAAQAATFFAYALWGGIKELETAMLLGLIAALAPFAIEEGEDATRPLAPLAIAAAALVGVLSFGAGPWLLGLFGAAGLLLAAEAGWLAVWEKGWRLAVVLLPLIVVGLIGHPLLPESTKFLTAASTDLGNLAGPVSPAHLLGIWPAHDFREEVEIAALAGALMAVVAVAALAGAWSALRERDPGLLVALGGAAIGCGLIAVFGSAWVAAKSYAIVSPFALLFAFAGLAFAARAGARIAAAAAALLLAAGVIWSNALGYGGVSLAPRDQLAELEEIGERFAGVEPALMTEYQPYGVRHFLREMAPEGASELRRRQVPLSDGSELEKGEQADVDRIALPALLTYRALVLRRSPAASRPPAPYRLAWRGRFYEVWIRAGSEPTPLVHLALGTEVEPGSVPRCSGVLRLARVASAAGAELVAADPGPAPLALPLGDAQRGGGLAPSAAGATYLDPNGPGEFALEVELPRAGRYEIWLGGSLRPAAKLRVDGEEEATLRQQLNPPGNYLDFGVLPLREGGHRVVVEIGGPDLHPGSAGSDGPLGPLVIARADGDRLLTRFAPQRAGELCGKSWDWIEVIPSR
jgi:hypothetical protein